MVRVNKMFATIKRRTTGLTSSSADNSPEPRDGDSPEVTAANAVKRFCTSESKQGDEVLFLPTIVDAAESSPAAAAECARVIRKYLARNYLLKPSHQYNAVMLLRILTDNPGPTFTRNLDKKFVETVKDLLKVGRDRSVLSLLMETLDTFEYTKVGDEGLTLLLEMWRKEKEKPRRNHGYSGSQIPAQQMSTPNLDAAQNSYFSSHGNNSGSQLPDPDQLASRLEEASTSANLLDQFVTNSTAQELLDSDLVKEFVSRCQSAHRSVQAYMAAENPPPDNDTMESLLDTSEQLQSALNTHRRAVLSAKKSLGIEGATAAGTPTGGTESPRIPIAAAAAAPGDGANGRDTGHASSSRSTSHARNGRDSGKGRDDDASEPKGKGTAAVAGSSYDPSPAPQMSWNQHPDDPFRDPLDDRSQHQQQQQWHQQQQAGGSSSRGGDPFAFEPFHPGFSAASGSGAGKGREDDDIYSGPGR